MISRIIKILTVLIILAAATAVIVFNPEPITVKLTPTKTFQAMSGVILLITFCAGFLIAALFGILYGIRGYFRERGLKHREQAAHKFYGEMITARSAEAAGEYSRAAGLWKALIKKDPGDIIARVELSRALSKSGDNDEALRILDKARATDSTNIEVLLRAADCNVLLGNKTAAIDNLALALYHHPHKEASKRARDLSEEIGRISDAIEYHEKYEEFTGKTEENLYVATRLYYKKLLAEHQGDEERREALTKFTKRNQTYAPAFAELARLENKSGNIESAADLFIKAAKKESCPRYWIEAIKLWLSHNDTERALSTARAACRNTSGKSRFFLECNSVRLLLDLQNTEEAQDALKKLPDIAGEENVELTEILKQQIDILTGYARELSGEHSGALEKWREMANNMFGGPLMSQIAHKNERQSHALSHSGAQPGLYVVSNK